MNIKSVSLELFGENVIIKLKSGTVSYENYGKEITGRLIGRKWGEKLITNNMTQKEEAVQTVIGITIKRNGEEIEINSDDIEEFIPKVEQS